MVTPSPLTITTRSGLTLHASEWSRHHAPVCLLLHGFAHDGRAWDPLALALSKRYRVIAPDFRGHGNSSWDSSRSYCHKALLEDLVTLIEQLGLQTFHLVGHSMGARVAMLYTATHNDKVDSLTIVDTGPIVGIEGADRIRADAEQQPRHFDTQDAYFQWLRARLPLASKRGLQERAVHGLKSVNGGWQPKTDPEFARILWQQDNGQQDTQAKGAEPTKDTVHNDDPISALRPAAPLTEELWDALDQITAPTLVVRGQLSSILKQDTALQMAEKRLVAGQLCTIPMAGHAVMIDKPIECSDAISAFIHSLSATPPLRHKRPSSAALTAPTAIAGARR